MRHVLIGFVLMAVFILGAVYELYCGVLDYKAAKYKWTAMEFFMAALFLIGVFLQFNIFMRI